MFVGSSKAKPSGLDNLSVKKPETFDVDFTSGSTIPIKDLGIGPTFTRSGSATNAIDHSGINRILEPNEPAFTGLRRVKSLLRSSNLADSLFTKTNCTVEQVDDEIINGNNYQVYKITPTSTEGWNCYANHINLPSTVVQSAWVRCPDKVGITQLNLWSGGFSSANIVANWINNLSIEWKRFGDEPNSSFSGNSYVGLTGIGPIGKSIYVAGITLEEGYYYHTADLNSPPSEFIPVALNDALIADGTFKDGGASWTDNSSTATVTFPNDYINVTCGAGSFFVNYTDENSGLNYSENTTVRVQINCNTFTGSPDLCFISVGGALLNIDNTGIYDEHLVCINSDPILIYVFDSTGNIDVTLSYLKVSIVNTGSGIDGIEYFDYENATTVDAPGAQQTFIVTEAKGPKISDTINKGIGIWETRTNLILASRGGNAGGWVPNGIWQTIRATWFPGNDNYYNYETIIDDTTGFHDYTQALTGLSAGQDYSFSCYFNPGNENYAFLSFNNGDGTHCATAVFNLTDGSVTSTTTGSSSGSITSTGSEYINNGWWRVWLVSKISVTSGNAVVGLAGSATPTYSQGKPSFTGILGNDLEYWGLQFEEGSFPTPIIYTSGSSTATRFVDELEYSEVNYTSIQTIIIEFEDTLLTNTSSNCFLSFGGGDTADDYISFNTVSATDKLRVENVKGGFISFDDSANDIVSGINKIAYTTRVQDNTARASLNGGTIFNVSQVPILDNLVNFAIGTYQGTTPEDYALNSYIRSVKIVPEYATDSQLQNLSS